MLGPSRKNRHPVQEDDPSGDYSKTMQSAFYARVTESDLQPQLWSNFDALLFVK